MAFRPPPSNLACSPHVRPPLCLSFTLVPDAMGCAGPVSMQPAPGTARATWSRSLDRQHARGARTRGPARKEGRRKQVRGLSTAARRHVRQPDALIDQLIESPSDGHKAGPCAFVLSRVYSVPRDHPRAHTLAAPRSARHTGRLQRLHPSRDQRARRPNNQGRRHPLACIVPALLYWWRLPGFPFGHRRRRGLRICAFRGSRDFTAGREAYYAAS